MSIFGPQSPTPTRINQVRINQSVLGYALPVVMGKGKIQQSLLWVGGFKANKISGQTNGASGKGFGGGKNGTEYDYTADIIAALCNGDGMILGIGDAWSGSSWLSNTAAAETYTITGGTQSNPPSYAPINQSNMTGDQGVSFLRHVNQSIADLGGPASTLTADVITPLQQVPYNPNTPLTSGQYSIDGSNNYYFSSADDGQTVTINYSFSLATIKKQEIDIVPSGLTIQVGSNETGQTATPFTADGGVIYYSTDGGNPKNGQALTRVYGTPTVTGTYSVSGTEPATYRFAPGDANQEVLITYALNNSKSLLVGTQHSLKFTLFEGEKAQAVWSLLESSYPGAALGYTGVAFVAYDPMDCGVGGEIQQNVFEVMTADAWGGGIADCNPIQCILRVLADPVWGLGAGPTPFPISAIDNGAGGTWGAGTINALPGCYFGAVFNRSGITPGQVTNESTASNWFAANGFFISPVIDKQDSAASLIGRWLEAGACPAFMSEGLLKLVPYGDTSTTGNGATWIAPSQYAAELDDDDFVPKGSGDDPVSFSSSPWQDAFNIVQIGWSNRTAQYGPEVTPESDQAAINRYGSRIEDPQQWDFITTLPAATFAASMRVKRNVYTRNTYQFTLPFKYAYLEPMDVVSITTSSAWASASLNQNLNVNGLSVRITKIVDNPNGTLDITGEDYAYGLHAPTIYTKATNQATPLVNGFADPGDTSAVVFEATSRLTGYQGNEIWMGASGVNADWGGCNVLASMDGNTYKQIGTITSAARLGELAAALPLGADPDTTDSMVVNLNENSAALEAGTQAAADQNNTLCFVDGELISYSACAVSGQDQYTMSSYIRRGQLGTAASAHAAGTLFLRLDASVFKYTYDSSWAGKTVYLKFQSFNAYGNSAQDISTLTAVQFTIPGQNPGTIDASTGLVLANSVEYSGGASVQSLKPAQAGADVTASNTAADTSKVNGVASHLISPISGLMPAQAGADVTSQNGNVLLQNPNFEAGAVGWAYGSGWSIVANGYDSGLGGINSGYYGRFYAASATTSAFTNNQKIPVQPGNVIQASAQIGSASGATASNVCIRVNFYTNTGTAITTTNGSPNITTYGPYQQSRVVIAAPANSAYCTIDIAVFSGVGVWQVSSVQAALYPNSLDEVPNGSSNFSVVEIDANRRALIDFSQGGHINKTASYIVYENSLTIEELRPAEVGADVTSNNTSKDTSAVNGQSAATVAQGATGINRNLVPDSDLKFGGTYWNVDPPFSIQRGTPFSNANVNPSGGNVFWVANFSAGTYAAVKSAQFSLIAGQIYTLSAYMNCEGVSAGSPIWQIYNPTITTSYAYISQAAGTSGRVQTTFTFSPSGVTEGTPVAVVLLYDTNAATTINGYTYVAFSGSPMVQQGSVATAYMPNALDDTTGYLLAGASQIDFGSGIHLNKTLDSIGDGTSYLRMPISQYGPNGNAIDTSGNLKLKNTSKVPNSATATLASGFADLPGLGSSNPQMTFNMKGNPALVSVSADFQASTSGGQVTSIGFTPGTCTGPPPTISIRISGDGSGASATVTWNTSDGTHYTSTLNTVEGAGYSYATAEVSFYERGGTYSGEGAGNYTCTVSQPSPVAGVSLSIQTLMDGSVLIDPVQMTTDANGRAKYHDLELFNIAAGTHTFQVQAKCDGGQAATFLDGNFMVVELG